MFGLFTRNKPLYEDLDETVFKQRFLASENAELIDVRTPSEYQSRTIKGARNINFLSPSFQMEFFKLPKEKEYFCFAEAATAVAPPVPC